MLMTREERAKMIEINEDYLFMLTEDPGASLRDSNNELWHTIVDHYEATRKVLEEDAHERIMERTTTHIIHEDGTITPKNDL